MFDNSHMVKHFPTAPLAHDVPSTFPSPFATPPHPLAIQASELLQQRLPTYPHWQRDFFAAGKGKMFGVLVVKDAQENLGYISAFSGMMNGEWLFPGFVPPIFDLKAQASFLLTGKEDVHQLAGQIEALEKNNQHIQLKLIVGALQNQYDLESKALKQKHRDAKAARKTQREAMQGLGEIESQAVMKALGLASQHHKREAANHRISWSERLAGLQRDLDAFENEINHLKHQRAEKSRGLHQQVFDGYVLNNFENGAKVESKLQPLTHFFAESTPPAGAADCAAPKLIHYAQKHGLQPIALAEFWWGASPKAGIRHHGQFYPACRGKCRPILPFMLQGLAVESEPKYGLNIDTSEPKIIYEDDDLLIINKPTGLMSTPGTSIQDSVFNRLLERYPDCPELRLVHRLDMDTSGLLLIAKNLHIHKLLQKQFLQRTIEKRYVALLSKALPSAPSEGDIALPLRVDYYDRPRQIVCYEHGKQTLTHWKIISVNAKTTRIYFYPHTGRSHQLRMHAAHPDGLNAAVVGDDLYGKEDKRLMLHAQRLAFTHPVSKERLSFEVEPDF